MHCENPVKVNKNIKRTKILIFWVEVLFKIKFINSILKVEFLSIQAKRHLNIVI